MAERVPTLAEQLDDLDEMDEDLAFKLADAKALSVGGGKGARLSKADAERYHRQRQLLTTLRAWLLAGRSQAVERMPVEAAGKPQDGRGGVGAGDGASDAPRPPPSPRPTRGRAGAP